MVKTIYIINGPNLNMLGIREPEIYGTQTLDDIQKNCEEKLRAEDIKLIFYQSNHEGELVTWIQGAAQNENTMGLIINAAAYTHTSIAIHDALRLLSVPIIEVHLSDPLTREDFRDHSFVTPLAQQVISGKGAEGYLLALDALAIK